MASSTVVKEQTMRRKDGSGEKELRGAVADIWALRVSMAGGWKRSRSWRSVISRVFDGAEGCETGGRELMSSVREAFLFAAEGPAERCDAIDRVSKLMSFVVCCLLFVISDFELGE